MLVKKWIRPTRDFGDVAPVYTKTFSGKGIREAIISITAFGVYEAKLNGARIGDYVLAPGWTTHRLQYQTYDVSHLLLKENILTISVGRGWYRSPLALFDGTHLQPRTQLCPGLCAEIFLDADLIKTENTWKVSGGEIIRTDSSWSVSEGPVRFSELYDGEVYDASFMIKDLESVEEYEGPGIELIPQQGEIIKEHETVIPARIIKTPKGELVIDFGQNMTGYVKIKLPEQTKAGENITISFAEVLDKEGNFYTINYRKAKSLLKYITTEGKQIYKPKHTFFGFRYIRLDECPEGLELEECFKAVAVYSDMKRTGFFECSNPLINKFYENVIWGQRGNFLDVPTDCPQRDERLGWTGDAQAFIKTAAYNYNVKKFFTKWLTDLALDQTKEGKVHHVIPDVLSDAGGSAAWADAATICPWEIYEVYGDTTTLDRQFKSMCKWVGYIKATTKDKYLWTGGTHFGDWLALDGGKTRPDFLASAFYANSTNIVIKAGKELQKDVSEYETLYDNIVKTFKENFKEYNSQTEHVLALHFNLTDDKEKVAKSLADLIISDGTCLQTGFVGTPYLLHVLSENGYTELAYSLMLRTEYPSWLYPVTMGATTIWERWDSIKPNGDFQDPGMNSFNHYAYGAAADWLYGVVAGIKPLLPGYRWIGVAPKPDKRLEWASAKLETAFGTISSKWEIKGDTVRYDIRVPTVAEIRIDDKIIQVPQGSYVFWGKI